MPRSSLGFSRGPGFVQRGNRARRRHVHGALEGVGRGAARAWAVANFTNPGESAAEVPKERRGDRGIERGGSEDANVESLEEKPVTTPEGDPRHWKKGRTRSRDPENLPEPEVFLRRHHPNGASYMLCSFELLTLFFVL